MLNLSFKFRIWLCLSISFIHLGPSNGQSLVVPFEKDTTQTATYDEIIQFYQILDKQFAQFKFIEIGTTDIGKPLHLGIISTNKVFDPTRIDRSKTGIFWVNNGIHPGEPEGIDAAMMFVRNLLTQPQWQPFLKDKIICVVPVYNVDGCLMRSPWSRANQNGPKAYGFRGNARNLDLNRDFIKTDTKNAQSFNRAFVQWAPHWFLDTHTSNGADYSYTMTLLSTLPDKLMPIQRDFLRQTLLPELYTTMENSGWPMTPYVVTAGPIEKGILGFNDGGRYSTGYASLHHCLGVMAETHMLKSFPSRTRSTLALMEQMLRLFHKYQSSFQRYTNEAVLNSIQQDSVAIRWQIDTSRSTTFNFKGYTARYKNSAISGLPRLYYDRSQPFEKEIPYYPFFKPVKKILKPQAYILPQAYQQVAERLHWNGVVLEPLKSDTLISVAQYRILKYQDASAYEGHYWHHTVSTEKTIKKVLFRKGDFVIKTRQKKDLYLTIALEPESPDGFFAWNFFDGILMQKEGYSDYVFEDLAAQYLEEHPALRKALEEKKALDPDFASNAGAQLEWVYKQSPWYEPNHMIYPVARIE